MRRGDLLVSDVGVRRDDYEALNMYQRACDGKLATALLRGRTDPRRGDVHEAGPRGRGGRTTVGAATRVIRAAASALGRVSELGAGGEPDMKAARAAYERAITAGSLDAKRAFARSAVQRLRRRHGQKDARSSCAATPASPGTRSRAADRRS